MKPAAIKAEQLSSCIGTNNILSNISFEIKHNTLTSILGPSGSGKTTLLKTIAGFQPICQGQLSINGSLVNKSGFTLAPDKRKVGMVFQDNALFPHLSVEQNIASGLKNNPSKINKSARLIEKLHLSHLKARYPHELSGGQQQRTALARALVGKPDIILLDEPFANLNQDLQIEVGIELVEILREQETTAIMVTHDQNDAMAISDHIIMLMDGKFIQSGTPHSLYQQPATREVASFLSRGSFIKAIYLENAMASTPFGTINVKLGKQLSITPGTVLDVWLHPQDILIDQEKGQQVEVINHSFRPLDLLVKIRTPSNQELLIRTEQNTDIDNTQNLQIKLNDQTTYSAFIC